MKKQLNATQSFEHTQLLVEIYWNSQMLVVQTSLTMSLSPNLVVSKWTLTYGPLCSKHSSVQQTIMHPNGYSI